MPVEAGTGKAKPPHKHVGIVRTFWYDSCTDRHPSADVVRAQGNLVKAPIPQNETERLAELHRYGVLDTAPEFAYDQLAELAASICGTPVAVVSLIDADRQWFKSKFGLDIHQTSRDAAFCAHTILGSELVVVPDATADERFADNPLVISEPHIRFYAGAPLITVDGHALGTLCVLDYATRELSQHQRDALKMLSSQVVGQLELGKHSST